MKVGIPREVKNHEYRVASTPAGVFERTRHGHEVHIEQDAGLGSAMTDDGTSRPAPRSCHPPPRSGGSAT
jgi:alanine dehydrogenase